MIGKPKYKAFDEVEFSFNEGDVHKGVVWIVDKWGTYYDKSNVSYDICVAEENMLYKHINEKYVKRKIK